MIWISLAGHWGHGTAILLSMSPTTTVRPFQNADQQAVVALSLKAWAPVFASLEAILGPSGIFGQLYPDWRAAQQQAIETACQADDTAVWVADTADTVVAGFAIARLDHPDGIGEIFMIAVDPEHQRHGIGSQLTSTALDWITDQGMAVAMVETGADPGHAPARALYENAGFTQLPLARYFKKLS